MSFLTRLGSFGVYRARSLQKPFSTAANAGVSGKNKLLTGLGIAAGSGLVLLYSLENSLQAGDLVAHPIELPWYHNGFGRTFDAASVRRGYFVYKNVCAACHSIEPLPYRQFCDPDRAFMSMEEAKLEAKEITVVDGPDEDGKMYTRPGKPNDPLPKPYPNDKAAAAANNGAIPPDLRLAHRAFPGGQDYIFALLTGYQDPPAGVVLGEGQAYNPYFAGGVLSMPQQLWTGGLEYPDGTPATQSQQAKDVTAFIRWTSQPWHDEFKLMGFKFAIVSPLVLVFYVTLRPILRSHKLRKQSADMYRKTPKSVMKGAPEFGRRDPFKSYAKVKFVNECLLYNDVNPDDVNFETMEAVDRLPQHEYDARLNRQMRAEILAGSNEILPKDKWTSWEDETWYLEPYLDEVEREKGESMDSRRSKPWWWYMRLYKSKDHQHHKF